MQMCMWLPAISVRGQGVMSLQAKKLFPLRIVPFEQASLSREASRKSQKLFPFENMMKNQGGGSKHLKYGNGHLVLQIKWITGIM